jgi:signal transduction histidine kinase
MLHNLQIRSKLAALLLVPLAAVIVLSSIGIASSASRAFKASRARSVTEFTGTLATLATELQEERTLAANYVANGKSTGYSQMNAQFTQVDRQVVEFTRQERDLKLDGYAPEVGRELRDVVTELGRLDAQRQAIAQSAGVTDTLNRYGAIIKDILDVNTEIAAGSDDEGVLRSGMAFMAVSRAKDAVDLERAFMNAVFANGHFDQGQLPYQQFARYVEAESTWTAQFNAFATNGQRALLATTVTGPGVQRARDLRDAALRGETNPRLNVQPSDWASAMGDRLSRMRQVEVGLGGQTADAAAGVQASAQRQAVVFGGLLLLVLLVAAITAISITRSLVRPLTRLRDAANEVADERLPLALEKLRSTSDPDRVGIDQISPAPVMSNDEVGQVASAFNAVHQLALRVAAEQAALRKSIGDMFANLARRSQTLLDRQLEVIERLERAHLDQESREDLVSLDQLAMRMRRNAEDLMVLSGSEPTPHWSQPVVLVEVVRAALAEVDDAGRVELLPIDDVGVAGHSVSDVVHIIAELIDNATAFSPPGTKVQVAGQPVSTGYVIEIEDRGLGMSDEELVEANERLANPPAIDSALSRMLGLFVIGRLAKRHGIRVQLRHSWYGGITALVLLPAGIIVRAPVVEEPPSTEVRRPELAPPPRANGHGGGQTGEHHLPIFEQAHSDWFQEPGPGAPLPRHPSQPAAATGGNGHGNAEAAVHGQTYEVGDVADELDMGAPSAGLEDLEPIEPAEVVEPPLPESTVEFEAADVVDAVEPVNPFDDDGPGEPGEPSGTPGPFDPARTFEPAGFDEHEPAEPVRPAEPAEPARAEAAAPSEPSEPFEPGRPEPAEPFDPVAGAEPVELPDLPEDLPRRPGAPAQPPRHGREAPREAPRWEPAQAAPEQPSGWPGDQHGWPVPRRRPPAGPGPADPRERREPQPPMRPAPAGRSWEQRFPGSPAPPAPPRWPQAPPPRPFQTNAPGDDFAVPLPEPTLQSSSVQTTKAGLPRRVPRANLAPGIVAEDQRAAANPESASPASSFSRSPDEVRSMLSSYRTGLERGRRMAAGDEADDRGEGARSGYGGPNPMAPRSDDDAAQ